MVMWLMPVTGVQVRNGAFVRRMTQLNMIFPVSNDDISSHTPSFDYDTVL